MPIEHRIQSECKRPRLERVRAKRDADSLRGAARQGPRRAAGRPAHPDRTAPLVRARLRSAARPNASASRSAAALCGCPPGAGGGAPCAFAHTWQTGKGTAGGIRRSHALARSERSTQRRSSPGCSHWDTTSPVCMPPCVCACVRVCVCVCACVAGQGRQGRRTCSARRARPDPTPSPQARSTRLTPKGPLSERPFSERPFS